MFVFFVNNSLVINSIETKRVILLYRQTWKKTGTWRKSGLGADFGEEQGRQPGERGWL